MRIIFLAFALLSFSAFGSYKTKQQNHQHAKGLYRHEHARKFLDEVSRVSFLSTDAAIPGSIDISPKVSGPEDQGQCGSCWDFSLTKALRSAFMVEGKDPGVLDFNYLLNNWGPGPAQYGCNGGDFDAAESFQSPAGPGLAKDDPYSYRTGRRNPNLPVAASSIGYTMLGGQGGPTFKDLAYAVGVLHQALSVDVAAGSGNWESYSGGIYDGCSGGENAIDHMINMVSYDCETSVDAAGNCVFDASGNPIHGDGWIGLMNNWGEQWGTKFASGRGGYMKSRYLVHGKRCNAVATDALMFKIESVNPPQPSNPSTVPTWFWWVLGALGLGGSLMLEMIYLSYEKPNKK